MNQTSPTPRRKSLPGVLSSLLEHPQVRRVEHEGQTVYAAQDIVAILTESQHPAEYWADLKQREPRLASVADKIEWPDGSGETLEVLSLAGVLRVAQSVPSPAAERVKQWLASAGREQIAEAENPELAWVKLQKLYDHKGYSNGWVQKRLRGMSARQELVSEWARRGLADSEEYRQLTNAIMQEAFGMDVNAYRQFKDLRRPSENLRDHMTDLELTLTMLGETAAVALHRQHGSQGFEQLQADVKDAGEITRLARQEIEKRGGNSVVSRRIFPTHAA